MKMQTHPRNNNPILHRRQNRRKDNKMQLPPLLSSVRVDNNVLPNSLDLPRHLIKCLLRPSRPARTHHRNDAIRRRRLSRLSGNEVVASRLRGDEANIYEEGGGAECCAVEGCDGLGQVGFLDSCQGGGMIDLAQKEELESRQWE